VAPDLLERRYGVAVPTLVMGDPAGREPLPDAENWLLAAAARHTSGDATRMAQRLLDDYRRGLLGPIALELPG
jgi:ribosome biogenesis GTPase A